ncbi:MAG TPA: GNAT family N-acetyltransferase [Propionibacteriaceae bacterium]
MNPASDGAEQPRTDAPAHPLDQAAWASLTGPHARFAEGTGLARRYHSEVSPFAALASFEDEQAWRDLHRLYGDGEIVVLAGPPGFSAALPSGWVVEAAIPGVQLVATEAFASRPDDEAFAIGAEDAPEAVDLVARTEPGPFRPKTHTLGTYLGLRRGGRLVALAGERMHPPGWSEISAVCTDPDHRRQGLATRLIRAVCHEIRARGETPFLHTMATNVRAIDLYLDLGFELRRNVEFAGLRTPTHPNPGPPHQGMTPASSK